MTAVLRLPRPLRRATVTLPAEATGSRPIVAPIAVATVLGVFAAFLALAGFHSVLVAGQFEVDNLQRRLDNGREAAQVLRMEVARLESPERILEVAQGRLGMLPPPQRVYLQSTLPGDPAAPIPAPVGNPFGTLHR
ncbi:MAG: hypothetical protein QF575_09170 [Acidimicrobiales bacterium]|jgi:hypothetical protein|nr:hypothetical protein [Acidimicrobiaceae bacterium]MDP6976720.1 hypothetical protein [Acidimicrobiales bacterium]|tara:strand:+ start:6582 stop:6989 length:408 start_codon:yes stop_codon:yes gene_type:complete